MAYIQHWTDSKGARHSGKVQPLIGFMIEAIGLDATVNLILEMGGAEIYIASNPKVGGRLESVIGAEAIQKLASVLGEQRPRIPLAPKFIARHLSGQGLPAQEIARQLRRTDVSIRKWLKPDSTFTKAELLKEAEHWEGRAQTLRMMVQE